MLLMSVYLQLQKNEWSHECLNELWRSATLSQHTCCYFLLLFNIYICDYTVVVKSPLTDTFLCKNLQRRASICDYMRSQNVYWLIAAFPLLANYLNFQHSAAFVKPLTLKSLFYITSHFFKPEQNLESFLVCFPLRRGDIVIIQT